MLSLSLFSVWIPSPLSSLSHFFALVALFSPLSALFLSDLNLSFSFFLLRSLSSQSLSPPFLLSPCSVLSPLRVSVLRFFFLLAQFSLLSVLSIFSLSQFSLVPVFSFFSQYSLSSLSIQCCLSHLLLSVLFLSPQCLPPGALYHSALLSLCQCSVISLSLFLLTVVFPSLSSQCSVCSLFLSYLSPLCVLYPSLVLPISLNLQFFFEMVLTRWATEHNKENSEVPLPC